MHHCPECGEKCECDGTRKWQPTADSVCIHCIEGGKPENRNHGESDERRSSGDR